MLFARFALVLMVTFAFVSACSSAEKKGNGDPVPTLDMAPQPIVAGQNAGGLTMEKGDVDGNGKADVWNYFKEIPVPDEPGATKRILVKKEADLDRDGRKDITRMFDDDGVLLQEEADLDFDGNVDQVNIYSKGILTEKRLYKAGEGRVFIWKFFDDGKLTRMNRDENGDGNADYCELWYAGEKLSKRGWDKDGDGECDYWENAD
jgi:hypothetical protein